jgi:hypothetical protein
MKLSTSWYTSPSNIGALRPPSAPPWCAHKEASMPHFHIEICTDKESFEDDVDKELRGMFRQIKAAVLLRETRDLNDSTGEAVGKVTVE